MNKYKLTRKEIIECMEDYGVLDWNPEIYGILVNSLLSTKEPKPKQIFEPKPYLCCESKYCSERFATVKELNAHKKTHEPKESKCECHEIPLSEPSYIKSVTLSASTKPKEKVEGFELDELFNEVDRCTKDGTNPEMSTPAPEPIEELEITTLDGQWAFRGDTRTIVEKLNQIITYLKSL